MNLFHLFLFLPILIMAQVHAPGTYPEEEMSSDVPVTMPTNPYQMNAPESFLFYYEKDPSPPGSGSSQQKGSSGELNDPPAGSKKSPKDYSRSATSYSSAELTPKQDDVKSKETLSRYSETDAEKGDNEDFGYGEADNNQYDPEIARSHTKQSGRQNETPLTPMTSSDGSALKYVPKERTTKRPPNHYASREVTFQEKHGSSSSSSNCCACCGEGSASERGSSGKKSGKISGATATGKSSQGGYSGEEYEEIRTPAGGFTQVLQHGSEAAIPVETGPTNFIPIGQESQLPIDQQPLQSNPSANQPYQQQGGYAQPAPLPPPQPPVYQQPSYATASYATAPSAYAVPGGCPCAPPPIVIPSLCCQPITPCCLPQIPCCPPPPPIPCCPQQAVCCQPPPPPCCPPPPPCCPQPVVPQCYRACPACPCRRRLHKNLRMKRSPGANGTCSQGCTASGQVLPGRAKRQLNPSCPGCQSSANSILNMFQGASGCSKCSQSHKRVKRMGCLPCLGRKKREIEEEHNKRVKRMGCLPCLSSLGRKKRSLGGNCHSCSNLGHVLHRFKRTICSPCGRKKRQTPPTEIRRAPCSCAPKPISILSSRSKRSYDDAFDEIYECDKSCCDFSKCEQVQAKRHDLI